MSNFRLMELLQYIPRIEELSLTSIKLTVEREIITSPLVMEKLRILRLDAIMQTKSHILGSCLERIYCPVLAYLQISAGDERTWMKFISTHSLIIEIDFMSSSFIPNLIDKTPQLESLLLYIHDEAYEAIWEVKSDNPPLPKLKQLLIHERLSKTLRLDQFENLVRARCLPRTHPQ